MLEKTLMLHPTANSVTFVAMICAKSYVLLRAATPTLDKTRYPVVAMVLW